PHSAANETSTWSGGGTEVLHVTQNTIRNGIVDCYVIELADWQRRSKPSLTTVGRDVNAAVVALNHPFGIGRIDPYVMMVAMMASAYRLKINTTIYALEKRHLRAPNNIRVGWIDCQRRVIKRTLTNGT